MGYEDRLLIDGELVAAEGGRTFATLNPATGQVLCKLADATVGDADRAIAAARRAFDGTDWATNRDLRLRCLRQLHEALVDQAEELRPLIVADVGAPVMLTHDGPQQDTPVAMINWYADLLARYEFSENLGTALVRGADHRRWVEREPVGVAAAIVPYNYPLQITLAKLVPALAAGCTVVAKGAPQTPLVSNFLGRMIVEHTDIPAGVVNVVPASDHFVGEELTLSPKVDMISFTGSTAVGQRIMEKGAATMKRLFLELGGKSATIVLDDLDDTGFNAACLMGIGPLMHAGQGCAAPTRMLLPRSRYDEGVAILHGIYANMFAGDPQDPGTLCGPVISARQRDRILGYIRKGVDEGATMLVGNTESPDRFDSGFWVDPTLFTDVDNSMTIAQEEIFGPVLVVIPYEDDDDAVRIANDNVYGLAGNVMSGSLDRSLAVARRLRAGFIGLNGTVGYGADTPFGGYKASGVGRQNGVEGFRQYTEVKSVAYPAQ